MVVSEKTVDVAGSTAYSEHSTPLLETLPAKPAFSWKPRRLGPLSIRRSSDVMSALEGDHGNAGVEREVA